MWRYDVENAPRGKTLVHTGPDGKGGTRTTTSFKAEPILGAVIDAGVMKWIPTYRTEPTKQHPTGWWAGIKTDRDLYAWAPMFDAPPEFPE